MDQKAVFWDFDGTLVYSNQSFLMSLQKAMQKNGYTAEEAILKSFLREACSWNYPEKSYTGETGTQWWEALLRKTDQFCRVLQIPYEIRKQICRDFREYAVHFPYKPYEDAADILSYTKERGYHNFLLSNNFPELSQAVTALGLDLFLEGIFLSADLGWEKPRLELFRYAARQAGNPTVCYMVGDNPAADILGGKNAGFHTILVHSKDAFSQAEYVCPSLSDIKNIL